MKKTVLTLAIIFGLGTVSVFAQEEVKPIPVEVVQNEFVKIEIEDLPEVITDAVKKDYEDFTIAEAYEGLKENVKIYKLVLKDADDQELVVLLKEKGEKVEE